MVRLVRPLWPEPSPQSQWRIALASNGGFKNQHRKVACQDYADSIKIPALHTDTMVAAVADGMGSAEMSRTGARSAVTFSIIKAGHLLRERKRAISPHYLEYILNAAMNSARMNLGERAERDGKPLRQYATTLLLLIYTQGMLGVAQIGDAAAVVADSSGQYITFSKPNRGEYANETTSVTSRRALQSCRIDIVRADIRHIGLFTDGMADLLLDSRTLEPHHSFFAKTFNWLSDQPGELRSSGGLKNLLKSEKVRKRTDDDTTLLLASR